MQCDIPVVVIAFHGAYTENEEFESPINASKINATSIGACNLLTAAVPNAIPKLLEELRMVLFLYKCLSCRHPVDLFLLYRITRNLREVSEMMFEG